MVFLHRSGFIGGGGVGRGVAPWTPAQLFTGSEYGAWLDPGDTSMLYQSGTRASPGSAVTTDGDRVGLALDNTSNELDFTQSGSTRPAWFSAANGGGNLGFNDGEFMRTGSLSTTISDAAGGFVMGVVFRMDNAEAVDGVLAEEDVSSSANRVIVYADTRSSPRRICNFAPDSTPRYIDWSAEQATGWKVLILSSDGTTVTAYDDNVSLGTVSGTANFGGATWLQIGAQTAGLLFLTGRIGGVVVREGEISATERAKLNTWLNRWVP